MSTYHIARVNIGRIKAPLEDLVMKGFVSRLSEINALADRSPGFVWRLQSPAGNATYIRPYDDDRLLMNMSVWETIEALREYVYRSVHVELLQQRHSWFEKFRGVYAALWWVPEGHIPSIDEAKQRLGYLQDNGPTQYAFTFMTVFPAGEGLQRGVDSASPEPFGGQGSVPSS